MYSGDEFYGDEVTSPFEMQRHVSIGNSALSDPGDYNMDGEDPAPTALLVCPACRAHIAFYGDMDCHTLPTITLEEYERYVCDCGAIYGEGDELEIVNEEEYDDGE